MEAIGSTNHANEAEPVSSHDLAHEDGGAFSEYADPVAAHAKTPRQHVADAGRQRPHQLERRPRPQFGRKPHDVGRHGFRPSGNGSSASPGDRLFQLQCCRWPTTAARRTWKILVLGLQAADVRAGNTYHDRELRMA